MKCPHCLVSFFPNWCRVNIANNPSDPDCKRFWISRTCICPSCERTIIELLHSLSLGGDEYRLMAYPKGTSRSPIPKEVPKEFAQDYLEACAVLSESPKASAALSRRALQHILRERTKTTKQDLYDQIQEVLDQRSLPTYLSTSLDAVRQIGNFAAHPIKSKSSGEIVNVEVGEAEWNLDVVESLLLFYFVQEAQIEQKKAQLNKKLKAAGKPILRS
jgi:hypothetical protein